jgi:ABC-type multidrug transport system fused ATPase/permease subunit
MEWIERCNLEDFLGQLPEGLHSQVGERGMLLSAGQRQVVALLRAMVRQPDLLILDEATASIDSATEVWVQRGIEHFVQGRNALLIAHRWSTLRFADRVLVMEAGRIVREGKATDLPELEELMREPEKA